MKHAVGLRQWATSGKPLASLQEKAAKPNPVKKRKGKNTLPDSAVAILKKALEVMSFDEVVHRFQTDPARLGRIRAGICYADVKPAATLPAFCSKAYCEDQDI